MHVIVVSTSAAKGLKLNTRLANLVARLIASKQPDGRAIVLDAATIAREEDMRQRADDWILPEKPFEMREWIYGFHRDQPVLNVDRVHAAAREIGRESGWRCKVVSAAGLETGLIDRAMNQLRIAMYIEPKWPQAFMLVVDDHILHDVASFAGRTFYIQPEVTGNARLAGLLTHIKRFSMLEGIFGLRHGLLTPITNWLGRSRRFMAVTEEK